MHDWTMHGGDVDERQAPQHHLAGEQHLVFTINRLIFNRIRTLSINRLLIE